MAGPRTLVLEIHNLTEHLYRVLQEQVGAPLTELVEHVFDLAKARRAGDIKASRELEKLVAGLDERQAEVILAAASLLFDLINMAEDRHRIRMLRDRERRSGDRPRPESIGAALAYLGDEGYSAVQIQGFLDKLNIEPVFTAHPTEAKRRTVRAKLKRIQHCLAGLYVNGNNDLLDATPWLARSIEERDPYVDPLNLIQAELMKRGRKLSGLNGEVPNNIRALLRQSIQGLSASMRTTG